MRARLQLRHYYIIINGRITLVDGQRVATSARWSFQWPVQVQSHYVHNRSPPHFGNGTPWSQLSRTLYQNETVNVFRASFSCGNNNMSVYDVLIIKNLSSRWSTGHMTTGGHQSFSQHPHGILIHEWLTPLLPVQQLSHCRLGGRGYRGVLTIWGEVGHQVPQFHYLTTTVSTVDQQRTNQV